MRKKVISILLTLVIILGGAMSIFVFTGCVSQLKITTEVVEYSIKNLKVGIISDTQLPDEPLNAVANPKYMENLKKALRVLKYQNVNMIIFAGDIGDVGTDNTYAMFNSCIDEVFGKDKPLFQTIMGNHDYWGNGSMSPNGYRKLFEKHLNQSPWTHYKVNGYHFIGASPNSGNMKNGYSQMTDWLDSEIKAAAEDTPDKPVFVTTHNAPKNTSYGSEDWGDKGLNKIFKKYPNVVNLAGHVHYSILDERSMYQGDYTVLNTQSLSYLEMEEGKVNGTIPPDADKIPMGYIMDMTNASKIEIMRYEFINGTIGAEMKKNMRWSLDLPFSKDSFKYTDEKRHAANKTPVFNKNEPNKYLDNGDSFDVTFDAAVDNDFVHSYKIVVNDKKTFLYFSDFYKGIERMAKEVTFNVKYNTDKIKNIKIYAIDSFGRISAQCIIINPSK